MAHNEHIKNHLRHEEELPTSLDWKSMEDGIYSKMDIDDEPKPFFWRTSWFKPFMLTMSLFSLIAITTFIIWDNNGTQQVKTEGLAKQKITQGHNKEISNQTTQTHNSNTLSSIQQNDITQDDLNLKENALNQKTLSSNSSSNSPNENNFNDLNQNIGDSNSGLTNVGTSNSNSLPQHATSSSNVNKNSSRTSNTNPTMSLSSDQIVKTKKKVKALKEQDSTSKSLLNNTYALISPLGGLENSITRFVTYEKDAIEISNESLASIPIKIQSTKWLNRISLDLGAGTTFWSPQFKGDHIADLRNENEHAILGKSMDLKLHYDLNDKWMLSTGLMYQKFESKFDFYTEKDTTVTSHYIQRTTNPISGSIQTTEVPTIVTAKAWREVVHYNAYTSVSIPLLLTRKWSNTNRLKLETGLGIQYNLSFDNNGKTVTDANENDVRIEEFGENTSNDIYKLSRLNILAGANLRYPITKKLSIGAGLNASYALENWSDFNNVTMRPIMISGGLNLGFRF